MASPWIKVEVIKQDLASQAMLHYPESTCHAVFACQVDVPSHQEWEILKWGFNKAALFEETLERQRLFLESQYATQGMLGVEPSDSRTLALRLISRPGEGLLVALLGKIHAQTMEEALSAALSYYSEVKSTLPYDYKLTPALSSQDFARMSGKDVLDDNQNQAEVAQIKRLEFPISLERSSPALQGLWRSEPHAHEQIWRSLSGSSTPLLLNITLRSTVLYETERARLLEISSEISALPDQPFNQITTSAIKQWSKDYTKLRLAPWRKFFYMQVHLASARKLNENLFRTVGTSLTMNRRGESQPGYQIIFPREELSSSWRRLIQDLEIVFSGSCLRLPRLSEVADLDEVFEVMRLPYSPPDNGFPEMKYSTTRSR